VNDGTAEYGTFDGTTWTPYPGDGYGVLTSDNNTIDVRDGVRQPVTN
jgi:hypothetical protein